MLQNTSIVQVLYRLLFYCTFNLFLCYFWSLTVYIPIHWMEQHEHSAELFFFPQKKVCLMGLETMAKQLNHNCQIWNKNSARFHFCCNPFLQQQNSASFSYGSGFVCERVYLGRPSRFSLLTWSFCQGITVWCASVCAVIRVCRRGRANIDIHLSSYIFPGCHFNWPGESHHK